MSHIYACLWFSAIVGSGLDAAPEPQIVTWVAELADPSFANREKAARDLRELGKKQRKDVESALVDAYLHSDDPEVRFRSREILTGLFANSLGYLGIRFAKHEHSNADGKKEWGIVINELRKDSPALKAKLRAGDIILKMNGDPFGPTADLDFAKQVKEAGTGQTIDLQIKRDGKSIRTKVILGTWPNPLTAAEASALFESKLRKR
jgi:C-terminal processing protease CtpA/Prc